MLGDCFLAVIGQQLDDYWAANGRLFEVAIGQLSGVAIGRRFIGVDREWERHDFSGARRGAISVVPIDLGVAMVRADSNSRLFLRCVLRLFVGFTSMIKKSNNIWNMEILKNLIVFENYAFGFRKIV